jgi:hypothetical protein
MKNAVVPAIALALALASTACGRGLQAPEELPPDNRDPVTHTFITPFSREQAKRGGHTWDPAWDQTIVAALPGRMLSNDVPGDVEQACPRFYKLSVEQKAVFWAYFVQSVAVGESDLDPAAYYLEDQQPLSRVTGQHNYSQGLLQLSYGDAPSYGCGFDWDKDKEQLTIHSDDHTISGLKNPALTINDPKANLECGVRILDRQLFDDRPGNHAPHSVFTRGRSYYWSTLRVRDEGTEPNRYDLVMKQLREGVPYFCGRL